MNPQHPQDPARGAETLLADTLHDTADGLTPNTTQLVRGGMARGRRMRSVRRAQVVVATLAVVAIGGAGTVVLGDLGGGSTNSGVAAAPSAPASGAGPTTGTAPSAPTPAQGRVAVTPEEAAEQLTKLLPAGAAVAVEKRGNELSSELSVNLTIDPDGRGAGRVTLIISPDRDPAICFDTTGMKAECELKTPRNGTLRLEKNWVTPASTVQAQADGKAGPNGRGPKLWSAWFVRADGVQVYVSASSSTTESGADTRPTTALTMAQLEAIATAPVWDSITPDKLPKGQPKGGVPASIAPTPAR